MCRADWIADSEVSDGGSPIRGGLGIGEFIDSPEAAVGWVDVDAAEIAGPAAAAEIMVSGLAGPGWDENGCLHRSGGVAGGASRNVHGQIVAGSIVARLHVGHADLT